LGNPPKGQSLHKTPYQHIAYAMTLHERYIFSMSKIPRDMQIPMLNFQKKIFPETMHLDLYDAERLWVALPRPTQTLPPETCGSSLVKTQNQQKQTLFKTADGKTNIYITYATQMSQVQTECVPKKKTSHFVFLRISPEINRFTSLHCRQQRIFNQQINSSSDM